MVKYFSEKANNIERLTNVTDIGSEGTVVIPRNSRMSSIKSLSNHQTLRIPKFLFEFLCLTGLLEESEEIFLYRTATITFRLILILINLSVVISVASVLQIENLKMIFALLLSFFCVFWMHFIMHKRRKHLTTTLRKFGEISLLNDEKKINTIAIAICTISIVFVSLKTTIANNEKTVQFETYGYPFENSTALNLYIGFKFFLYTLVHPTFTCLVSLFFCMLCQRCRILIDNLTEEIRQISPEDFGSYNQVNILKRKAKIDQVLNSIQEVFSLPSFLIIVANFLTCSSVIGWVLRGNPETDGRAEYIEALFWGITNLSNLIRIMWLAGDIPIQVGKLKEMFYEKLRIRLFYARNQEEFQLKPELFGQSDFVFTGCHVISLNRSTVLAVCGTLLTYTVLLVSFKA
ncbi:uncharacterized protein NPIL_414651 [Nephila pilipes]|uniref:Gustatory receptor n=1 Tax=Nephila pilipes TaxID=299642 RepID=A0A8X6NNQ8_NEPPI|nr:uncharacterized protein NPIL_414651 [Nephila pilipes]